MLDFALTTILLFAPPAEGTAAGPVEDGSADPGAESGGTDAGFGELHAEEPEPSGDPGASASGGYGGLTPLTNYADEPEPGQPAVEAALPPPPEEEGSGFQEPEDYGPFFEVAPVSEVRFPGDAVRPDKKYPFASVGKGPVRFCFVEDSECGASLIADADVGVGLNLITSNRGLDVPYSQVRVRGGMMFRPLILARKHWHPWGVGLTGSYSIGSASITATTQDSSETFAGITETSPIRSARVALVNQLWLAQKRNAVHLDFSLGGVNSSVLNASGRYWGTHAEFGLGFGGWGGLFVSGDFLDQDSRVVFGMRGHGIVTGPIIALALLGLVAGGVAL